MAQWHVDELRHALERSGWKIMTEEPVDGYRFGGTWLLQAPPTAATAPMRLDFDGVSDAAALPPHQCYGCHLRGPRPASLYFGQRGRQAARRRARWQAELADFMTQLEQATGP